MLKTRLTVLTLVLLAVAAVGPALATDSLHIAHSIFQVEKNNQKHPLTLTRTILINQDVATPRFCSAYYNSGKKNQGWGVANVEINRVDGTQDLLRIADQVKRGSYVRCTKANQVADLVTGDLVVFNIDWENMLRLKKNDSRKDQIDVNALVVADGFPLPLGTVGVTASEHTGGWFHVANYNFQAPKNNFKHPEQFTKMVVMPRDAAAPLVCPTYRHTLTKKNKGTVAVETRIYHEDEIVETLNFSGKIRNGAFNRCQQAQDMVVGDVVEFLFTFNNLPRLKKGAAKTDYAEASAVVSNTGEPKFASAPDVTPDPGPGTTPPPSGGLSSADLTAAAKLLMANKPVQLWRFKGDKPKKWTVVGPRTNLGSGLGGIDTATAGYGNTIAEAVADYERKRGKLNGGGSLSTADVNALVWFSKINSSAGPTSLRRSRTGGFYGEYYRPGRGANHNGPYTSVAKGLGWLQSQGL